MPTNEDGESVLIALGREGTQQLLITVLAALLEDELAAEEANTIGQSGRTHESDSGAQLLVTSL